MMLFSKDCVYVRVRARGIVYAQSYLSLSACSILLVYAVYVRFDIFVCIYVIRAWHDSLTWQRDHASDASSRNRVPLTTPTPQTPSILNSSMRPYTPVYTFPPPPFFLFPGFSAYESHVTHTNTSCHTCKLFLSRVWTRVIHYISLSHVTIVNTPCFLSRQWLRLHMWTSHITHENHPLNTTIPFPVCTYVCVRVRVGVRYREVGGWGRDPKECTGRDWGMGSSTI